MRKGDLVVPWNQCAVTEIKEPTFYSRGRSRGWNPDQPATIVAESTREIRGNHVLKIQILLDGELWWIGAGAAHLLEPE
jgi:hypothetical protein